MLVAPYLTFLTTYDHCQTKLLDCLNIFLLCRPKMMRVLSLKNEELCDIFTHTATPIAMRGEGCTVVEFPCRYLKMVDVLQGYYPKYIINPAVKDNVQLNEIQ